MMQSPLHKLSFLTAILALALAAADLPAQTLAIAPTTESQRASFKAACEDGIRYDDGEPNNAIGWVDRESSIFVMRFDDVGLGSSLDEVCVCLTRTTPQGSSSLDFDLVFYADDAGDDPGTSIGRVPVSAEGLPIGNTQNFYTYNVAAADIAAPSRHVWIGVELPRDPTFDQLHAICIDQDSDVRQPIFTSTNGGVTWSDVTQLQGFGDPDALLVRATVSPSRKLILPFYEVDATSPDGESTFFAVRNPTDDAVTVRYTYFSPEGAQILEQELELASEATRAVNMRTLNTQPVDDDGFQRGYMVAEPVSPAMVDLIGDFFQIDGGNDFATGERMIGDDDFCHVGEVRFLDFGAGTELRILLREPQGPDPLLDPASFRVRVLDEAGVEIATRDVHTGTPLLSLTEADFTEQRFGTLVFDFTASQGGYVFASYSAENRFSVGLETACRD